MNIFERAARSKLRFPSNQIGVLTVEELWDLPLTSERKVSLDSLARSVNRELKFVEEDSFVEVKPNPRKTELTLQLDILKHVITAKQADAAAAEKREAARAKQQKLLAALAKKRDDAIDAKSEEELLAELQAANAEAEAA